MATRQSSIIDPRTNLPVQVEELTREIAAPSLGSVRHSLSLEASNGIVPQRLASILRNAENDDMEAYLSLAEEMEEKDLHYLSVLGTRKRQVSQLAITLSSAAKDAGSEAIAKDVQENLIDTGVIDGALFDMLDAVGKGFSLMELIWRMDGNTWRIDRLEWVNPRFLRFDRATMREPMLIDAVGQAQPLAPYKFAYLDGVKSKSGLPIRGGLARPVAWAWMFKNFAIKDWVQFAEVYGIPWRIGSYDSSASEAEKAALLRSCCQLSSDAAAIKPRNMDIQIVESGGKTASSALYGDLAKYLDDQTSKAVLGQTRTMESDGGGLNNGDAGTQVREDIERADAKALSVVINRSIIRPYVDLNHGPQQRYPTATIGRAETQNAQLMVDATQKLVALGFRVRQSDVREAVGFAEPQDNDELFVAPAAPVPFGFPPATDPALPAPSPADKTGALDPAVAEISLNGIQVQAVLDVVRQLIAREIPESVGAALIAAVGIPEAKAAEMAADALRQPQPPAPANDTVRQAVAASRVRAELLAQEMEGGADAIATAARQQAIASAEIVKPLRDQVLQIAALSRDEGEFRRRIAALRPALDMSPLIDKLAGLTFQAVAGGIAGDKLKA